MWFNARAIEGTDDACTRHRNGIAQPGCEMIAAREGSSQSEGPSNGKGHF